MLKLSTPDMTQRGATVFNNNNLTWRARVVYGIMLKFADQDGRCRIRIQTLMREMDVSNPTITRATRELAELGVIKRKRGKNFVHYTLLQ